MVWGLPWAEENTWSLVLGALCPLLEFLRRVTVSRASVGSLPPRLAIVCNVFMYVFVNVTNLKGGGAAAAALMSALPIQASLAVAK